MVGSKINTAAIVGMEMASLNLMDPTFYILFSWKVYDIFLKDKMNKKFSTLQIEHIDFELVKMRETRAKLAFEHKQLKKEISKMDDMENGSTAKLDAKTSVIKLQNLKNIMVDAEYDIRYLCLLRRFFVRMSKHDRERLILLIKPMDTKQVGQEKIKEMMKSQKTGNINTMFDAYQNIELSGIDGKQAIIDLLSKTEGTLDYDYEKMIKDFSDIKVVKKDVREVLKEIG